MTDRRLPNTSRTFLMISVAFNFFLLGFLLHPLFVHPFIHGPHGDMPPFMAGKSGSPQDFAPNPRLMLRMASQELSPAGQATMANILDGQEKAMQDIQQSMMQSFMALHQAMGQDRIETPFLQETLDTIGKAQLDMHRVMSASLLRINQELSAEDRKTLARHIGPPGPIPPE